MTPESLVGLLAEPERLRVVAALVLGARTAADVVDTTRLDTRRVENALRRLRAAGLVDADGPGWRVREELFGQAARLGAADRVREDPFVRDGRLVRLPAQRGRRRAVLERVCASFEPGRRYPEREVVAVLGKWCDGGEVDHVTVRRYLVDEGLLDRAGGEYWRSGGPVDVGRG
ncbi:DUF2087 domain-containing protein [Saccharothrix syringae]|uniref:DUF2087 domain-containing protein n=1 Tax=Saccharothrix syringae TaxID=103733 RepID=A0A5Q0GW24_SACSY|nr:DUF2087 domain-containing protein [Saccharothrix syringae]QFZ18093.1 DUF2087 domain-containing protein [Saccharothrix syringae]